MESRPVGSINCVAVDGSRDVYRLECRGGTRGPVESRLHRQNGNLAKKEARESRYWLRLALKNEIATGKEIAWELREANELLAMIISAIRTAQSSPNRGAR